MKKGDKVRLKYKRHVTGEIIKTRMTDLWGFNEYEYQVKYDQEGLIPPQDWHRSTDLEDANKGFPLLGTWSKTKCECGVDRSGVGGRHSEWCPLKYKNY